MLYFYKSTSYLGSSMYYTTTGLEIFVRRNSPISLPALIYYHEYSLDYIDDIASFILRTGKNRLHEMFLQYKASWAWQNFSPMKFFSYSCIIIL